jgi:AraC-like DNA-binding protein
MKQRVARAKELISKGQPLVEIAAELGFASQSHFSGVFRKVTGVSPGRFRQCEADTAATPPAGAPSVLSNTILATATPLR